MTVKAIRLAKLAREINVGIETIAETLRSKGFDIDAKPTSKLTPEMHTLLLKEFKSSIELKERADQINIGVSRREKLELDEQGEVQTIDKEEVEKITTPEPPKPQPEEKTEEIIVEVKPEPTPVVEKAEEPPVKEEVKITTPQVEKTEAPIVEKQEAVKEIKEELTPPPVIEEKKQVEPVAEVKKEEEIKAPPVTETPPSTPESKPEEKKEEPKKEIVAKEDTSEEPKKEEKKEEKSTDSPFKVVGKIDLDNIGKSKKTTKSKPPKKEKPTPKPQPKQENKPSKPKEKPQPKPKVEAKPTPAKETETKTPKKAEEKDNFIKTQKHTLSGPKVLGKIELPVDKAKKDDKPKRKRKRIRGKKTGNSTGGNTPNNNKGNNTGTGGGRSSGGNRGGGQGGNNFRRGRGNNQNKRNNRKDEPQEVSEKEIQDKIKETMAKLGGGAKKNTRQNIRRKKRDQIAAERERAEQLEEEQSKVLQVTEFISVSELASMMEVPVTDLITTCFNLGTIVSINQRLDAELIEILADEFGFETEFVNVSEQEEEEEEIIDAPEDLVERAPIVTIMGHVDHGKTSLLDYIRNAKVVDGEMGGITQHIGAYEVETKSGKSITFLDTPGHEAFTAMRARGAKVTDIAVIVIAADDAVMPQTKEAISHAQAAGVPIVFAFNKIDREAANPDKIKEQLSTMNLLVEDWGGTFQSENISAKTGLGVDELLEKILLEAELLELKANPDRAAQGSVVEASLDKGRGYVSTILVQTGTLRVGDMILAGTTYGKVKAMYDELGNRVKEAPPSTPVLVLGLNGAPQAGEKVKMYESEQEAKSIANRREQIIREQGLRTQKHITLDEIGRRLALGNFQELNLIVKGDVDGSVEALSDSLLKLSTEEIQINVIHKSVGQITETDVLLATASDAIIVGFQVRPSTNARKIAERENIDIRLYSIIYAAIEELKSAMEGMLKPKIEEKVVGQIEIKETFKISKVGTIAGCFVTEGKIFRDSKLRVIRDGIVIYTSEVEALKRFKDDVKEVGAGMECGVQVKNYNDIKAGDNLEIYEEVEVKRTLSSK